MKTIRRFLQSDDGPVVVEYSVMLAMIILTAIAAITTLSASSSVFWGNIDTEATDAFDAARTANSDG